MKTNNVDYFLIADYQRLKQVLLNLINNAIKYNKPNGFVETTCDLISNVADGSGDWVRINITDSGKGIAEENLYKVFEPFERVGAEITEIEGSGLGLSIVKKLVDAMGGKVGVASELGKGTTFWLELPLADNPANQIQQHEFISGKINAPSQKVGNLLYIEDNSSNIDLMVQVLEEYRPSVNLITNMYGKNTVQFAKDYSPFLILLDLNLPDIHGYEIVKLLKADMKTKDIPVVIVSADAMEKQVKRLMDEGVQGYLTKPVDIEQLLDIIDKNLNV
ncbi:ATP-binding protein [Mariniphaga anaerophila]|nr:ATP-binding protein [Mariniphaga anaerophila]